MRVLLNCCWYMLHIPVSLLKNLYTRAIKDSPSNLCTSLWTIVQLVKPNPELQNERGAIAPASSGAEHLHLISHLHAENR